MWKDKIIKNLVDFKPDDKMIYSKGPAAENNYLKLCREIGGTDFFGRAQIPGTCSFFDTRAIYNQFEKIFIKIKTEVILDLGCGDGRAVKWFLENTSANIIAVDAVIESLNKLHKNYLEKNEDFQKRLLLIHSNVLDMPIVKNCADIIWSFEVLCYLQDDFEKGLKKASEFLKKGGLFLLGERTKEFAMLHGLFSQGIGGFIDSYEKNQIIDDYDGDLIPAFAPNKEDLIKILSKNSLEVIDIKGISFFPLIISSLRHNGVLKDKIEGHEEKLIEIFEEYSSAEPLNRSSIYICRKK